MPRPRRGSGHARNGARKFWSAPCRRSAESGQIRLGSGQAWLGLPFVQFVLEQPPEYRKWAWAYRAMKGPLTLRIYTRNADRLRALLQS